MSVERAWAVALLSVGVVFSVATPASASCVIPPPMAKAIREAPAVFVGTVVETSNMRRWVTVAVSEVWKGNVGPEVEVRAGPKDPPGPTGVSTSVDRHYRDGETYLFLPYRGDGNKFRDSDCSRTTRYESRLDRFKPAGAESPSPSESNDGSSEAAPEEDGGGGSISGWVIGVALIVALGAGLVLVRKKKAT